MGGHGHELARLKDIVAFMREAGVYQYGDIILGPLPAQPAVDREAETGKPPKEGAARKRYYEEMLGRPVAPEELSRYP